MSDLFLKLVHQSLSASYVVGAVLLVRLVLKKAPKGIHCLLWALVAFRLICPVTLESPLSLVPHSEPLTVSVLNGQSQVEIHTAGEFQSSPAEQADTPQAPTTGHSTPVTRTVLPNLSAVWVAGMVLLLSYSLESYWRMRRKVAPSIDLGDGVYLCDYIDTPFILGVFRPRIYLPSSLSSRDADLVLAHERSHLRRWDHWWKPLGFVLLSIYWFNPVMWLAYILLCRDIEMACDEQVVKTMGIAEKKAYSQALLNCSVPRKMVVACPLAFGEVGVKQRVKSVLNYKKPAFWIVLISVLACITVAVCFLTERADEQEPPELPAAQQITVIGPTESLLQAYPALRYIDWSGVATQLYTRELTLFHPQLVGDTLFLGCQYPEGYGLACLEKSPNGHFEIRDVFSHEDAIATNDDRVSGFRYTTEEQDLMVYVCWNEEITAMEWAYGYWDYILLKECPGLMVVDTANWLAHFDGSEYFFRYDAPIPFTFDVANDAASVRFLKLGHAQYLTGAEVHNYEHLPLPGMYSLEPEACRELTAYLAQLEPSDITPGHRDETLRLYVRLDLDTGTPGTGDMAYVGLEYDGTGVDLTLAYEDSAVKFPFRVENDDLAAYLEALCDPERVEYTISASDSEKMISYSHGYANMSVQPLINWEYEIVPYTNDQTPFGIRGRPKYCDEGWVFLSFWPSGFDPQEQDRYYFESIGSSTSLCSHITSYPSQVAGPGYFNPEGYCWSYIRLVGLPGDYVILNEGADSWLETHDNEVSFHMPRKDLLAVGIPHLEQVQEIAQRLDTDVAPEDIQADFDWKTGQWSLSTSDSQRPALSVTIGTDGTIASASSYPMAGD